MDDEAWIASAVHNAQLLESAESIGCFRCLKAFAGSSIRSWRSVDGGPYDTANCPYCDSPAIVATPQGTAPPLELLARLRARAYDRFDPDILQIRVRMPGFDVGVDGAGVTRATGTFLDVPVRDAEPVDGGAIVLLDYYTWQNHPPREGTNLFRVTREGDILWQAEVPPMGPTYVAIMRHEGLRFYNGSYAVTLDLTSGKILAQLFTK